MTTPRHANIRQGGNVKYMRVTPAEQIAAKVVSCMTLIAAALFVAFIASVAFNGITITEIKGY